MHIYDIIIKFKDIYYIKSAQLILSYHWGRRAGLMSCQSRGERQCFCLCLWCIDHIDRWTCHSASAKLNATGHARKVQASSIELKWPWLDKPSERHEPGLVMASSSTGAVVLQEICLELILNPNHMKFLLPWTYFTMVTWLSCPARV